MSPAIRKSHTGVYTKGAHSSHRDSVETKIARQRKRKLGIEDHLKAAAWAIQGGRLPNLKYLLPIMLNLNGEPYTLDNHFPFEPFFKTRMIHRLILKCGRQVSKSTSLASQGIVSSNCIPYFNTLYVTPLFEMIRRFSSNYMAGFIRESPIKRLMVDSHTTQNVLQRGFKNESKMFFSFAFQNCDRTRGLNTSKNSFDEVQDLDPSFIPIINETMSGSKYGGIEQHTGTPKTLNGTLEKLWLDSSRAEWHIFCRSCGYENIPSLEHDLTRMTGPDHVDREVSEAYPGLVCARERCSRPVYPRDGHWIHHSPELLNIAEGYHVPQQIMPMHYADPEKWGVLLGKRAGFGLTTDAMYWNEVCGESYDEGARLITQTELKRACTNRPNNLSYAAGHIGDYIHRVISVDWGGGGQKEVSFTVAAVLGMKANGDIDVLYAWRSRTPHDHNAECREIFRIMATWHCTHLVHDYNGAGDARETIIVNAGYPARRIIPMVYLRAGAGALMRRKAYNPKTGQRLHYQLDKARSLVQCCNLIRFGKIKFFRWDGATTSPLISDFLSLTEDMVDSRLGSDVYTIIRDEQAGPDDFAHAVNMGSCALFWRVDRWPNMAELAKIALNPEILRMLNPAEIDWGAWGG